jgi:hypothetical protein
MQESFEAIIDSLILVQDEHIVVVVPYDTVPPQISHVFISPILHRYY